MQNFAHEVLILFLCIRILAFIILIYYLLLTPGKGQLQLWKLYFPRPYVPNKANFLVNYMKNHTQWLSPVYLTKHCNLSLWTLAMCLTPSSISCDIWDRIQHRIKTNKCEPSSNMHQAVKAEQPTTKYWTAAYWTAYNSDLKDSPYFSCFLFLFHWEPSLLLKLETEAYKLLAFSDHLHQQCHYQRLEIDFPFPCMFTYSNAPESAMEPAEYNAKTAFKTSKMKTSGVSSYSESFVVAFCLISL